MQRVHIRDGHWRLVGWALAAAQLVAIGLWLNLSYAVNDDAAILQLFMGYFSDDLSLFHVYLHPLLCAVLKGCKAILPSAPWFSILQITLLTIASASVAGSLATVIWRRFENLWAATIIPAAFLWIYLLLPCTSVTYTQTTAVLGMAAVLRLYTAGKETGSLYRAIAAAGVLWILAYALRAQAALPALAFCGLFFVLRWIHQRENRPALLRAGCVLAAVMAGLCLWQQLLPKTEAEQEYLNWHDARVAAIDYNDLSDISENVLKEMGWTETTARLLERWCFLDEDVNAESLTKLTSLLQQENPTTPGERLREAWRVLTWLWARDESIRWPSLLTAVLLLIEGFFCLMDARSKHRALLPFGTLLLGAGMLFVLAWRGRLPTRAAQTVLLICGGLAMAQLALLSKKQLGPALLVIAVACVLQGMWQVPALGKNPDQELEMENARAALEESALCEEEMLFIYDDSLMTDLRMFPDVSEGIPQNTTPWGGWLLRSAQSVAQMERFGLDPRHFDPAAFLREDVCLVTGIVDPGPEEFAGWLREKLDMNIDYFLYSEYEGIYCWQFYES